MDKLKVAIHKFTSCDGCQLAFLTAGEALLELSKQVELLHFIEAGLVDLDSKIDIAFIEGSISTPHEADRIQKIRANSKHIITIGACATAGGIQALRNSANHPEWMASIYASPQTIQSLNTSSAIAQHVRVDWELWGCPVNSKQVLDAIGSLLKGAAPKIKRDAVCLECKRKNQVCVMVTRNEPCMGPVTKTGCYALCPGQDRGCYACYGPSDNPNTAALGARFKTIGLNNEEISRRFLQINNQAQPFQDAGNYFKGIKIVKK